jgi:hypothetical protein
VKRRPLKRLPTTTRNAVARAVMMANQVAVPVPGNRKVSRVPEQLLRRALNAFVPRSRKVLPKALHLRKQENNHAATSTQKIS